MAPARLYVPVTSGEFQRIRELAWHERRTPVEMAAYLLGRAIVTYEQHRSLAANEPFPHPIAPPSAEQGAEHVPT